MKTRAINEDQVIIYFGIACECEDVKSTISMDLYELMDISVPVCAECGELYHLVQTVIVEEK